MKVHICMYIQMYIYIYIYISCKQTAVEGDPKAHFTIDTTLKFRSSITLSPGLLHLL